MDRSPSRSRRRYHFETSRLALRWNVSIFRVHSNFQRAHVSSRGRERGGNDFDKRFEDERRRRKKGKMDKESILSRERGEIERGCRGYCSPGCDNCDFGSVTRAETAMCSDRRVDTIRRTRVVFVERTAGRRKAVDPNVPLSLTRPADGGRARGRRGQ